MGNEYEGTHTSVVLGLDLRLLICPEDHEVVTAGA
jgi:hypothetical protein